MDLRNATSKTLLRRRRDDLVRLCEERELTLDGTKKDLVHALLQWVRLFGREQPLWLLTYFFSPCSGRLIMTRSLRTQIRTIRLRLAPRI